VKWISWLLLALALAACEPSDRADEHAAGGGEPHADHALDAAEGEPGVVIIDPEMLRDLRITTARAESRAGGEATAVLGEVGPNEDAYGEVAAPVAARVVRLLAASGDRVEAGQALVELESPEVGRARAEERAARARAELARRALARKRDLVAERIAAGRELQEAQAEAAAAEAELDAARAALAALGAPAEPAAEEAAGGSRFRLRAPLAGSVIERSARPGQMVSAGSTLFRVADLATLWVTVHAFERDALRVQPGAAVEVGFAALPGRSVAGRVLWIGSQVEPSSRTIPIRIAVENGDALLRPGMSATARLPLGAADSPIVTVPAAALQRTQDGWAVFLPREAGRFELRNVGRGRDFGGEVEVMSGLGPGESVVVDGAFLLKAEVEKARGEGAHHDH
jgi:cobalt-zinc-cadmium efflux system membrane fusion protein